MTPVLVGVERSIRNVADNKMGIFNRSFFILNTFINYNYTLYIYALIYKTR